MKVFVVLAALMCVASAGLAPIVIIPSSQALLRTPGDSAIVRSERLGGNFAYTVAEGQAFRTIQPILTSVSVNSFPIFRSDNLNISFSIAATSHSFTNRSIIHQPIASHLNH